MVKKYIYIYYFNGNERERRYKISLFFITLKLQ